MTDPGRRRMLTMLGAAATALGSGCTTILGSTAGSNDGQPNETDRQQPSTTTGSRNRGRTGGTDRDDPGSKLRRAAWASGTPLSADSGLGEWTATNGSVSSTDWHGPGGDTGVELVSPGRVARTAMRASFDRPIDLTNAALSFGVRLDRAAEETIELQLLAPDADNRLSMERYLKRKEGTVRVDFAPSSVTGAPDLTDVRGLAIKSYTGDEKPLTLRVGAPRLRKLPQRRGAVILTFDDGHHTQFDTAKPIMDEFGYPGVVGVIPWFVGNEIRATRSQLHTMADDGWEMASHPQFEETPLPTLSRKRQREAIERSQQWLIDEGFDSGGETLIWPFGDFDEGVLDMAGRFHELAFGGGSSPAPWAITEPTWVPRINGDNPDEVRQAVDMAAGFGGVTTVMFHTIGQARLSTAAFRDELRYIEQADVDVVLPSALADAQPY
ncbi:polysaccharide deacetylase family protein [Halococcus morrhuae DSM 1307]|uniref:polysaccharide deacetylase family protein n=1 Tax=Halococcus morrhuae TaxID=2250 RepID=UPI003F838DF5